MIEFIDDDLSHLAWVAANPGGYVLNVRRSPDPGYVILHRASCESISNEGHPLYCPPLTAALTGNQAMSILESFIADHPETADKTYGLALSAGLRQAFSCTPS